jgi:uncharacterized membrane protein (UPF0127 family)
MKKWVLPAIVAALAAVIAWPFIFGGGTVEVKGRSFNVEHRLDDGGAMSRAVPIRNRGALDPESAILCTWDRDRYAYFWSDGAKAAFDVAYLDASGKVLQIGRIRPFTKGDYLDDYGMPSEMEVRRALFLPEGAIDSKGLAVGESVSLSSDVASAKAEPLTEIKVGGKTVRVEIAETLRQRSRGLMHRAKMSKDEGMLFLYPNEQTSPQLSFYMRHTLMSLDIAYFDGNGNLVNVQSTERAENPATQGANLHAPAKGAAQFVLEVPIHWFRDNGFEMDRGKPVKPVSLEMTDALRKRASQAEGSR